MSDSRPRVALRNVTKAYPLTTSSLGALVPGQEQQLAVNDVTLTVEAGDRIGIVGRNGAGKSTLLHLIAGLTSVTAGEIETTGAVTSVMTLGVGLRDEVTGRENIYLDGQLQAKSRDEMDEVIERIISFADLGKFIDHPVRTYSTGMKARLAFAMISQLDPEILIVDEALSVGDAAFSVKATQRIKEICERGKIVMIVSHSMNAIREMCNRCLWMEAGRVIMDGPPAQVTSAYVDSVRAADGEELLARFQRLVGVRSFAPGWMINGLTFHTPDGDGSKSLVEAGAGLRIRVMATTPPAAGESTLHLRIIRLDGLVLFDEQFDGDAFRGRASGTVIDLEVEMTPLVLGASVYRCDVALLSAGERHAEASSVFEVYSADPPGGGVPMLLYPVDVSIRSVRPLGDAA